MAGNAQSRYVALLPIAQPNGANSILNTPGLSLNVAPGGTATAPASSAWLSAAQQFIQVALTGTTAQRPASSDPDYIANARPLAPGTHYLDTSLGYIVIWDGAYWRNPATGASV